MWLTPFFPFFLSSLSPPPHFASKKKRLFFYYKNNPRFSTSLQCITYIVQFIYSPLTPFLSQTHSFTLFTPFF